MKTINKIFKGLVGGFLMLVVLIFWVPFLVLFPTRIYGKKNLKKVKDGAVVASNHFSNMDPVLLKVKLFKNTIKNRFLGKAELNKSKFLGWLLSAFGIVYINRGTVDRKAIREVDNLLKRKKRVVIFPEGTRNKSSSEDMQSIKSGVVFFAKKAEVPILPIRLERKPKIFRLTRIFIGESYNVGDNGKLSTEEEVKILEEKFSELNLNKFKTPKQ